jgi:hypothetical protein
MNMNGKALLAAAGIATLAFSPAYAYEANEAATKAGAFIGASAGVPPPGIYMFNQVFTYETNLTGPGTSALNPSGTHKTGVQVNADVQGFLFVPGWTFLGATYDAVIVQPFVEQSVGVPINAQASGAFNTYVVPVELSWKFGNSGFAAKTGVGIYTKDGSVTGANGVGNVGNPFWTFQPELILSYLKDGWNLSAAIYEEFNTANTRAATSSMRTSPLRRPSANGRSAPSPTISARSAMTLARSPASPLARAPCFTPRGSTFGRSAVSWGTTSEPRVRRFG